MCFFYYFFFCPFSSVILFFFFLMIRPPPRSPLFPYPTLFRSEALATFGIFVIFVLFVGLSRDRVRDVIPGLPGAQRPADFAGAIAGHDRLLHGRLDRKSTRLNSSHLVISYAVFCLKKKKKHHFPFSRTDTHSRAIDHGSARQHPWRNLRGAQSMRDSVYEVCARASPTLSGYDLLR